MHKSEAAGILQFSSIPLDLLCPAYTPLLRI
jgi:hypothetical protein